MDANLPGTFLLNGASLGPFPEAKAPVCQYSVQSSFYKLGPPGLGAQLAAGTPHGISDILGRPAAAPGGGLLPGYPHGGGFNGLSSPGVYYGPQVGALPKAGGEYPTRGRSCWAEAAPEWRARQGGGREYRARRWAGLGGGHRCRAPCGALTHRHRGRAGGRLCLLHCPAPGTAGRAPG